MANTKIPNVNLSTSVNTWRTRFNQLLDSVGEVNSMTTTAGPVALAINELDSDLFGSGGGRAKTGLATTAKNIQDAINELDSDIGARPHTTLTTTAKTLTAAINEHETDIGNMTLTGLVATNLSAALRELRVDIGDVGASGVSLSTTATDLAAAINELDSDIGARPHTTLTTIAKTLTGAINELDSSIGAEPSATLTTTAKTLTAAINELKSSVDLLGDSAGGSVGSVFAQIGDLSALTTSTQSSLVAAINELDSDKVDKINITGASVGSGTAVPVITFNAQGQITSATTTQITGISSIAYRDSADSASVLVITTPSGQVFKQTIHMNKKVGKTSDLNTVADSSIVASINELDRRLPDIYDNSGTLINI